jgi:hypothetical protein
MLSNLVAKSLLRATVHIALLLESLPRLVGAARRILEVVLKILTFRVRLFGGLVVIGWDLGPR